MSKSWNSAKSRKKLSKNKNLPNFGTTEARPRFLTSNTKNIFNYLQLPFTRVLILLYFNPKYYIWIETNALSYTISGIWSQLTFGTSLNKVVTKTN